MYLDYYELTKEPFPITPNPEFLYLSPSQKEALAAIIYGIEHRKGFVAIIGEVGIGKTTILRYYLQEADKEVIKVIYIYYANVSFKGILKTMYQKLGLAPETDDLYEMVNRLHLKLVDEYEQGHIVVLLIDEAHYLSVETLENIRQLTNMETSEDKLLQVVLIGQPELEEKLNLWELRQLNQRIVLCTHIVPFSRRESVEYIQHRLAKAGGKDTALFRKSALNHIIKRAQGIPRVINILCNNALIYGFGAGEKKISVRTAKEAIATFDGRQTRPVLFTWLLVSSGAFLLAACLFLISPFKGWVLSNFAQVTTVETSAPVVKPVEDVVIPEAIKTETVKTAPIKTEIEPTPQEKKPEPVKSKFPVKRVVKEGDTLYSLVRDVYGITNKELMELVMQQNKQIKDENEILAGNQLIFPEPKKRK